MPTRHPGLAPLLAGLARPLSRRRPRWRGQPAISPAIDTAAWPDRVSDPRAAARPHSAMFPVMTLAKTSPSLVKLATSVAPEAKVSAIAISVRTC